MKSIVLSLFAAFVAIPGSVAVPAALIAANAADGTPVDTAVSFDERDVPVIHGDVPTITFVEGVEHVTFPETPVVVTKPAVHND